MRYCPNLLHQSSKAGIQTDARFVHYAVGAGFKSAPTVHLYYITVLGRPDTLYALGRDGPADGRAAPQTKSVGKGIGCILLSLGLFCRGQVFCRTFSLLFPDWVFYARGLAVSGIGFRAFLWCLFHIRCGLAAG